MPAEIGSRILRLPGYGIYGWDMEEATNTLTLSIRQTVGEPSYICGGCGRSVREIHTQPTEFPDAPTKLNGASGIRVAAGMR